MRCKLSLVRHEPRCTEMMSPFASGLKKVSAGMVEIEVKADAKALKALKAGFKLRVSGPFTFQSALEGSSVTHTESAVVRLPSKRKIWLDPTMAEYCGSAEVCCPLSPIPWPLGGSEGR